MTIKPGTLVYDKESGRYDIRSGLNEYYGGLHCGQSFEVFDGKHWKPTRIEMDMRRNWYLVGIDTDNLEGLRVRRNAKRYYRDSRRNGMALFSCPTTA